MLWLILGGPDFFMNSVQNQIAKPLGDSKGFLVEFFDWLKILIFQVSPLALLSIYLCFKSRDKLLKDENLVCLFLIAMMGLFIMLFIDSRPRYLLVPLLSGAYLCSFLLPKISVSSLLFRRATGWVLATCIVLILLFSFPPFPLHRSNAFVKALSYRADLQDSVSSICLGKDLSDSRKEKYIRRSQLLLWLEFDKDFSVFDSQAFVQAKALPALVDSHCKNKLTISEEEKLKEILETGVYLYSRTSEER
jgi:hypothetical protein